MRFSVRVCSRRFKRGSTLLKNESATQQSSQVVTAMLLLYRQFPNLDVPEPTLVVVIGQHNVTFNLAAESGRTPELALGDAGLHSVAAQFVFQHLRPIEPVLDVVALNQHARAVPLAGVFERLVWRR